MVSASDKDSLSHATGAKPKHVHQALRLTNDDVRSSYYRLRAARRGHLGLVGWVILLSLIVGIGSVMWSAANEMVHDRSLLNLVEFVLSAAAFGFLVNVAINDRRTVL